MTGWPGESRRGKKHQVKITKSDLEEDGTNEGREPETFGSDWLHRHLFHFLWRQKESYFSWDCSLDLWSLNLLCSLLCPSAQITRKIWTNVRCHDNWATPFAEEDPVIRSIYYGVFFYTFDFTYMSHLFIMFCWERMDLTDPGPAVLNNRDVLSDRSNCNLRSSGQIMFTVPRSRADFGCCDDNLCLTYCLFYVCCLCYIC